MIPARAEIEDSAESVARPTPVIPAQAGGKPTAEPSTPTLPAAAAVPTAANPVASAGTSVPLTPLPRAVLAALADIADIEGLPTEASYWRDLLASLPEAQPSAATGGHGAQSGHDSVSGAASRPHN